jgi:hypothetical protein
VIVAELAAGTPRGEVLPYGKLADAIGVKDNQAGRSQIRQAVSAARPIVLRDHNMALVPVRNLGYRVAYPGEFAGIAQDHRRRSDRQLSKALAVIDNAPLADMTPAERKRHEAVGLVLRNVVSRMSSAEQRLADLETVVYGPPRKVIRGEVEDSA